MSPAPSSARPLPSASRRCPPPPVPRPPRQQGALAPRLSRRPAAGQEVGRQSAVRGMGSEAPPLKALRFLRVPPLPAALRRPTRAARTPPPPRAPAAPLRSTAGNGVPSPRPGRRPPGVFSGLAAAGGGAAEARPAAGSCRHAARGGARSPRVLTVSGAPAPIRAALVGCCACAAPWGLSVARPKLSRFLVPKSSDGGLDQELHPTLSADRAGSETFQPAPLTTVYKNAIFACAFML